MADLIALSNWLNAAPEHTVAVDSNKVFTTLDLKQCVSKWMNILAERPGGRWAVYHPDTFEFMAILLALWQLDRTACVPGDNCTGTVERLRDHVDGFIGDFPDELAINVADDGPVSPRSNAKWKTLHPNFIAIEIYTSGSTGEPKPITKSITQLEHELEALEAQWPSSLESVVLSTVSHQHLYGMTFRLLWPLCLGQPFSSFICEYSEDVFHYAQQYSSFSLIASPSHLSRMNTVIDWNELSGLCSYVICSAAPLSRTDSLAVKKLLNTPIREIYGSSETGAIAWRIQQESGDDALWQPLPSVELESMADDCLKVCSPHLDKQEPLVLADKVRFSSKKTFELIGRADNIAKIEGKRVSLTAIESILLDNDWVEAVKVLTLNRKRVETATVIQLTGAGAEQLDTLGRKSVINTLKKSLSGNFESVVLPRRWRFVEQMPYNAQGKLPMNTLRVLFEKEPLKWPEIKTKLVKDSKATIECYLPVDLIYFAGHFEGNPILPGVTQVYWAEKLGLELFPVSGSFKRLEVIKFLKIIRPNSSVVINLDYNDTKNTVTFSYESEKGLYSSGRICFG